MLRSIFIATSAVALLAAAPALAAPAANWTGFYAGLNGGYGGDQFKYNLDGTWTDISPDPDNDSPATFGAVAKQQSGGFVGGGQVGYAYQFSNDVVVGVEADIDASTIKARDTISGSAVTAANNTGAVDATIGSQIDYIGTVRARLGMSALDGRVMPYITGGMAYGQVKSSASFDTSGFTVGEIGGVSIPAGAAISQTATRVGWTLGAGADVALTDQLSLRAEYLYVDLGKSRLADADFDVGDNNIVGTLDRTTTAHLVRVGFNYRFGG